MRPSILHRSGRPAFVIAVMTCLSNGALAQSPGDARFEAIVSLAQAKMREFGVPGVALGILHNGTATIRGLGITNVED